MPAYDYVCLECETKYEQTFSYTEKEKPCCPKCKSKKFKKIISIAPFVKFVGDGFTKNNN